MVEFKRKKGESFEAFLRRFNKGLIRSKKLQNARQKQHMTKKANKKKQKDYALISKSLREKRDYLKKIGKLPEDATRIPKK